MDNQELTQRGVLPPEFQDYARAALAQMRAMCDDPETPVKIRADIEKWFAEMWYGKCPQAGAEGRAEGGGVRTVRFEGVLEEWSG